MSYKSKRTITNMIVGIGAIIAYTIFATSTMAPQADDLKGWAIKILIFIGAAIGVEIIVQILFHIGYSIGITVKEDGAKVGGHIRNKVEDNESDKRVARILKSNMIEDEMEKTIYLKSARIGYIGTGVGFLAALITLTVGQSTIIALHIQLICIWVSMFAEGITSIYLYERGV